ATLASVRRGWKRRVGSSHMDSQLHAVARGRPMVSFFWNYNTVESTLLFCAVLITLAGVMFQSGQLDTQGFEAEKSFVSYVVVLVIVLSVLYFVTVLSSEIYLMCSAQAKKKKEMTALESAKLRAEIGRTRSSSAATIVSDLSAMNAGAGEDVSLNPLFSRGVSADSFEDTGARLRDMLELRSVSAGQWAGVAASVKTVLDNFESMAAELADCKKQLDTVRLVSASGGKAQPKAKGEGGVMMASSRAGVRSAPRRASSRRQFQPTEAAAGKGDPDDDSQFAMRNPLQGGDSVL
ncbi:MAG: hypothetical protein P4N59_33055, partial [Negativicutes bacterium]|nr:hypothetical protein [Negativicutes bacterium]